MGFRSRFDVLCRGRLVLAAAILVALVPFAPAHAGYAHFVIDANSGKVLSSSNADVRNYPASLTKMMTLYMTFEALHKGRIRWDSRIVMTRRAASAVPLKLGLKAGRTLTVREAVLSMIVLSANDSAETMCDYLSGPRTSCGTMLTRKARQLGMTKTTFRNGSGLPDKRQVTTARDMARLGLALMRDYPNEYKLFSTRSFSFRGRTIRGHNHLMYRYRGMDGIKTGFTNASGFNIVTAVRKDGKRVIGVVMGGRSARSRDDRMASLLNATLPKAAPSRGKPADVPAPAQRPVLVASLDTVPIPQLRYADNEPTTTESETAVEAAVETPAMAETPAASPWAIQIAAVDSEEAARALLKKARASASRPLNGVFDWTERVDDSDAALVRARFAGFGSSRAAQTACRELKARSFQCIVLSNKG